MVNILKEIIDKNPDILRWPDFSLPEFAEFQKKYEAILQKIETIGDPSNSKNYDGVIDIRKELQGLVTEYGVVPFLCYNSAKFIDTSNHTAEQFFTINNQIISSIQNSLEGNTKILIDGKDTSIEDLNNLFWNLQEELARPYQNIFTPDQQNALALVWSQAKLFSLKNNSSYSDMLTEQRGDCSSTSYLIYSILINLKDKDGSNIFTKSDISGFYYREEGQEHFQLNIKGKNYESQVGAFPGRADGHADKEHYTLNESGMLALQIMEDGSNNLLGSKVAYVMSSEPDTYGNLSRCYSDNIKNLIDSDKEYEAYKLMVEVKDHKKPFNTPYDVFYGSMLVKYGQKDYFSKVTELEKKYQAEVLTTAKTNNQEQKSPERN